MIYSSFFRYVGGGIVVYLIKILVSYVLTEIAGLWYFYSYIISLTIILIFSFFWTLYVTFRVKDNLKTRFVKYIIFFLFFIFIDIIFVKLLTEKFEFYYMTSIIITTTILFVIKFFVYRLVVFKKY